MTREPCAHPRRPRRHQARQARVKRLLIADLPIGRARRQPELVIWIGPSQPPDPVVRDREVVRLPSEQEAIAYVTARSPVQLRLQLERPLRFLQALATTSDQARAA